MSPKTVLVTAATGDQGRAITRSLLAAGHAVVGLARADAHSAGAREILEAGGRYVEGDLASVESIEAAMAGVDAVVSVPVGPPGDELAKVHNVERLINIATKAGVGIFVQTTTAAAERHIGVGDFGTGQTSDAYGLARLRIEALLRQSALDRWTVLRPVAFMENFLTGKAAGMFPWLSQGRLDTVHCPDIAAQLVTVADIGAFAAAAVSDPARFERRVIELNGQVIVMPEVAEILSQVTGKTVTYRHLSVQDALAAGMRPGVAQSQEWANRVGYNAPSPAAIRQKWGIKMTSFEQFAKDNLASLDVGN